MRRFLRVACIALTLVVVAVSVASCGGSDGSKAAQASGNTTTLPAGSATITQFEVPTSAACGGKTSVMVSVSYATAGATTQALVVDGREVDGTESPSATLDVQVHCDELPHTFVLIAEDARQRPTTQQKILMTAI